jgi:hypothetical protein
MGKKGDLDAMSVQRVCISIFFFWFACFFVHLYIGFPVNILLGLFGWFVSWTTPKCFFL